MVDLDRDQSVIDGFWFLVGVLFASALLLSYPRSSCALVAL